MRLVEDPEKLIRLEALFDRLFRVDERTVLVKTTTVDPVYYPQSDSRTLAEIHFANEFFSSALHEIAHWLIAGSERRTKLDYGYWYKPDGRDLEEQQNFERFEARNQGLEWILSTAANHDFHVSADNLSGEIRDGISFARAVRQNALSFLKKGFSGRSKILIEALITEFGDQETFSQYWDFVEKNGSLPHY